MISQVACAPIIGECVEVVMNFCLLRFNVFFFKSIEAFSRKSIPKCGILLGDVFNFGRNEKGCRVGQPFYRNLILVSQCFHTFITIALCLSKLCKYFHNREVHLFD